MGKLSPLSCIYYDKPLNRSYARFVDKFGKMMWVPIGWYCFSGGLYCDNGLRLNVAYGKEFALKAIEAIERMSLEEMLKLDNETKSRLMVKRIVGRCCKN